MKKTISLGTTIFICLLCCVMTFVATYSISSVIFKTPDDNASGDASQNNSDTSEVNSELYDKLLELDKLVRSLYIKGIDEDYLSDYVMTGYIAGLDDKYSTYYSADSMASYLAAMNSKLVGIGVYVVYDEDIGGIYITGIMEDSPALDAGLSAGDVITSVEGIAVTASTYNQAVLAVKGEIGDKRVITVKRAPDYSAEETITVTLRQVTETTVTYDLINGNIAYIKISQFNTPTSGEFAAALENAKQDSAKYYIFDVRGNPGGNLTAITEVLDMLLPEGPIVRIESADGKEQIKTSDEEHRLDAPMAVLINGSTASAAELFTSALRDYEKATSIGTNTFGKGTMQTVYQLSDGSGVVLSTNLYNPPYGDNYEGVGIAPDIEVTLTKQQQDNFYKLTYEEDPQLQKAILILTNE
ncbi:MAG TPA: S41 family peptidase [Bacillota bacterium]|nr:S41 family peptidase [Bacillota bacterium]